MLNIRIKTSRRIEGTGTLTLSSFFKEYFNQFYIELNSLLSDYHSIQEHSNRSKIVEFIGRKLKDLDLLQMLVKGCFLFSDLKMICAKGEDCVLLGQKVVEMADFLAMLFESMKTSFIPGPNLPTALQTLIDPSKLLPRDAYQPQSSNGMPSSEDSVSSLRESDFDHIHRLMRIYLLKESARNYEISRGVLILKSKFFEFELALCGDIRSPEWRLFKTRSHTCSKQVEDYLLRKFHSSLSGIVRFTSFYESRKNASEIFSSLESGISGFYQNFTGKIGEVEISGVLRDSTLWCTVSRNRQSFDLVNPSQEDIQNIIADAKTPESIEKAHGAKSREFRRDVLGENIAHFDRSMFFCFSKISRVCYIGKYPQICSLKYIKLDITFHGGRIVAVYNGDIAQQNGDGLPVGDSLAEGNAGLNDAVDWPGNISMDFPVKHEKTSGRKYKELTDEFVKSNARYLALVYSVSDLRSKFVIDRCISSDFFRFDCEMTLYSLPDGAKISYQGDRCGQPFGNLAHKIRLLHAQRHTPKGYDLVSSREGEKLQLQVHGIRVLVAGTVKTDLKFLTEDCRNFNLSQALTYIRNFGRFYKFSLHPFVFYEDRVVFDFEDFTGEAVQVCLEDNFYRIKGPHTLQTLKVAERFAVDDSKVFLFLFKVFIADRFMRLKKAFNADSREANLVDLGNGRSICLTAEGLRFRSNDTKLNALMTRALNTERSIFRYLNKSSEELLRILQSPK